MNDDSNVEVGCMLPDMLDNTDITMRKEYRQKSGISNSQSNPGPNSMWGYPHERQSKGCKEKEQETPHATMETPPIKVVKPTQTTQKKKWVYRTKSLTANSQKI